MVRPTKPLINRSEVVDIVLKILDEDGLGGLSIRRIADKLGVNGASLYHHFKNKSEILDLVLRKVLAFSPERPFPGKDWKSWYVNNSRNYRRALLEHPNVLPLLVEKRTRVIGARFYNEGIARLKKEGISGRDALALAEQLEALALGSAMLSREGNDVKSSFGNLPPEYGALRKAINQKQLSSERKFLRACRAIIDSVDPQGSRSKSG